MSRSWSQIHLIAMREAMRAHQELGIDTTRRIDPYAALEASGVVPMRTRLDHLAGLYIPANNKEGNVAGALINVAHPPSKQRYTAAHELCHHRRDAQFVLDSDTEWLARGERAAPDRERIAEAFAAWFLMPKSLVSQMAHSLGLRLDELSAADAYMLSLELGTSYAATVRHLSDLHMISSRLRDGLLRQPPQAIKGGLGALDAIADPWRDVRLIHPGEAGSPAHVMEGDAVVIEVPEIPSTGYRWEAASIPPGLSLIRDEYRAAEGSLLGGQGQHRFIFRVDAAGADWIELVLRRAWQPLPPADTLSIHVDAESRPTAGIVQPTVLLPVAV